VSSLLGYARAYAARNWPLFPLQPRSKAPATAHGFLDATVDDDIIRRWFEGRPDLNIASRPASVSRSSTSTHPTGCPPAS
jgi:hypothetical protein